MNFIKKILRPKKISKIKGLYSVRELFDVFDVFYVCFDEPNRIANWKQIKENVPKAKKIEGVVGFDQALKVCANQSKTKHFFLIDGDNQIISDRLDRKNNLLNKKDSWVLSWASFNPINGLAYGNGGLKLWPKDVALKIQSHENSSEASDQTDYCFVADYYMIDDFVTQTIVNSTPQQAFRAGLREGVKMTLEQGEQVGLDAKNIKQKIARQNFERLKIWCEVGADAKNGYWAILGARYGFKLNVIDRFDCKKINSYEWIDGFLKQEMTDSLTGSGSEINVTDARQVKEAINHLGGLIEKSLEISFNLLSPQESLEFRKNFKNPIREGLLKKKPGNDPA